MLAALELRVFGPLRFCLVLGRENVVIGPASNLGRMYYGGSLNPEALRVADREEPCNNTSANFRVSAETLITGLYYEEP